MSEEDIAIALDKRSEAELEKWKAANKALQLSEKAGSFLYKIVGPAATQLGGVLGDQMKEWRASNLDRISQKWMRIQNERCVGESVIQALPFGDAYRTIDSASKEDDPDVQELWAQIICNATDGRVDVEMKKLYVDLLEKINGLEAKILSFMFVQHEEGVYLNDQSIQTLFDEKIGRQDSDQLRVCIDNLQRIGIVTPSLTEFEVFNTSTHEEWVKNVREDNFIGEVTTAISNIVAELTHFSGSPMNDMIVAQEDQIGLVRGIELTRIGWDLYGACSVKSD